MASRDIKAASAVTQKQARLPFPVGGMNYIAAPAYIPEEDGYYINNLFTRPFGLEVRKGYRQWLPIGYSFTAPVGTLLSYDNPLGVNSKLFACLANATNEIYDVTTPNVTPTLAYTAGGPADIPGEWSSVQFKTPAATYLCAQLQGRGYYTYNGTAWAKIVDGNGAGQINFASDGNNYTSTSDKMMFVFSWKNRLWFLEKDRGLAWYGPLNSVTGKFNAIDLGQFLKNGGGFSAATNWTYDSGSGMDDGLVFLGNNGDTIIYEGTDPSQASTFRLKGVWFLGRMPVGRRNFCQWGGDVLILTEFGVMSLADFVSGRVTNPRNESSVAQKFNPYIARAISARLNERYWALVPYLGEEQLVVTSPNRFPSSGKRYGYTMGLFRHSWAFYTEMEPYSAKVFQGKFFFGTREGGVYLGFDGYTDNVSYDSTVPGNEVIGQIQTGFYDFGDAGSNKRLQRVRILGRVAGNPAVAVKIEPEYNLGGYPTTSSPVAQGQSLWDSALWDVALWDQGTGTLNKWIGVRGFGKKLSLLLAVRGLGETLLTDFEVTYEEGRGF